MKQESTSRALRMLFERAILVAAAVPGLHCGSTVISNNPDAGADVATPDVVPAPDTTPLPDVVSLPDVVPVPDRTPPDARDCTRSVASSTFCEVESRYPCGLPLPPNPDGSLSTELCRMACTTPMNPMGFNAFCALSRTESDGTAVVRCTTCVAGRRPVAMTMDHASDEALGVAAFLAQMAALEGAAVTAFEQLAAQLATLGAPDELLARCREAADDERRHTLVMTALAEARGGVVPRVQAPVVAERSLLDFACDNAAEGCVRETYGALMATWQAGRAEDPEVAAAMAVIADEEIRHAALSWDLARWAEGVLDDDRRAVVAAHREEALRTLRAELVAPVEAALVTELGIPSRAQALRLLDAVAEGLA